MMWTTLFPLLVAAVSGQQLSCRCVEPIKCAEAILETTPRGCRLASGDPGVCCPSDGTPSAPTPSGGGVSFPSGGSTGRRSRGGGGGGGGGGGPFLSATSSAHVAARGFVPLEATGTVQARVLPVSRDAAVLQSSSLPQSASTFLQRFPLDSADAATVKSPSTPGIPIPGLVPPGRGAADDTRPSVASLPAGQAVPTEADSVAAERAIVSSGALPRPTAVTTQFNRNFRTSTTAQDIGRSALLALQQTQVAGAPAAARGVPRRAAPTPRRRTTGTSRPRGIFPTPRHFGGGSFFGFQASIPDITRARRTIQELDIQTSASANGVSDASIFGFPISRATQPTTVPGCTKEPDIRCNPTKRYRSQDGTCNNLQNPRWGRSLTGLRRLFPNTFEDGIFEPRAKSAQGGQPLPSARRVSVSAFSQDSRGLRPFTMSLVTWGQFMDHDLSISPLFQLPAPGGGQLPIECCEQDGRVLPPTKKHPQCLPIPIDPRDPYYRPYRLRCMNFVRSVPALHPLCRPRPATQLNELTSWIDCSQVYGSTLEKAEELRSGVDGLLRTSAGNLLPRERPNPTTNCTSRICFIAGDERVNENPLLTLFHTLFMREHNRVARELKRYHRSWSDETLFQRARRIVIAEWQHITYQEWLPALVGFRFARLVGLTGPHSAYLSVLNPTISTEFSTAGFRLHSMVQGMIDLVSRLGGINKRLRLEENFFRPDSLVVSRMFSEMVRGMTRQQPQSYDKRFQQALRGDLFKVGRFGLDLMALNIQRGRDHGIPVYATVLATCSGRRVAGWADIGRFIPGSDLARLRATYKHWRDVDLFVGLNMETPPPGALLGPTARCLLAEQFLRLRYGDRFFYNLRGQPGSFNTRQLAEIERSTWARILCDNVGPGFDSVQPLAFIQPIDFFQLNPVVKCNSPRIKKVDLSKF